MLPIPGDLFDSGIKAVSLTYPALAGGFFTSSATWEAHYCRQDLKNENLNDNNIINAFADGAR